MRSLTSALFTVVVLLTASCGKNDSLERSPFVDAKQSEEPFESVHSPPSRNSPYAGEPTDPDALQSKAFSGQNSGPDRDPFAFLTEDSEKMELLKQISEFRRNAARNLADAAGVLGENGRGFESLNQRELNSEYPFVWPYFFASSIVMIGNAGGDTPVVCFYNPLVEGALISTWRQSAGNWKVEELAGTTAAAFVESRRTEESDPLIWQENPEIPPISLVQSYQAFRNAFEMRFPPCDDGGGEWSSLENGSDLGFSIIEGRSFGLAFELGRIAIRDEGDELNSLVSSILRSFASGREDAVRALIPANNLIPADRFIDMGSDYLAALRPAMIVPAETAAFVCLVNSNLPTSFVAVELGLQYDTGIKSMLVLDYETDYSRTGK